MPDPPDRLGVIERGVEIVRGLTLSNILMMLLILVLAVPSWFAWRFMQDTEFRHEFLSTSRQLQIPEVPCLVILGNLTGRGDKYTVGVIYELKGLEERMVGIRMPFTMSNAEIRQACDVAHQQADLLKAANAGKPP